jgi:hypothetical protein
MRGQGRRIYSDAEFDQQVAALGGYEKLDPALNPVIDGLYDDPYGYPIIQNDWISLRRYARTIPQNGLPGFVVTFVIQEDGTIELCEIWPDEDY